MAAPILNTVYPANNDTGIPVGSVIKLWFNRTVDEDTVKKCIVLVGQEQALTSGPDSAVWIDNERNTNPFFLRSPGFKGILEFKTKLEYYDLDTLEVLDAGTTFATVAAEAAYGDSGVGHLVTLTPVLPLSADMNYKLHIIGDPDEVNNGISSRTVHDVVEAAVAGSGECHAYGGYTGSTSERLHIKITSAGGIGDAKFKYWYHSAGEVSAKINQTCSRRFRTLVDGIQVRFTGSSLAVNDTWTINVEPIERLATSTIVSFTTNDGSYTDAPDSPSTPAASLPPSSVLPLLSGNDTYLQIVESVPPDGAYQVSTHLRKFTITFDNDLNSSTVTQSTVKVYRYPISGLYENQPDPIELAKKLTVSGDTLTIEI